MPNKWERDQGLQLCTIKTSQELINLLHKLVVKTTLRNPYKTSFYPFPQIGNLVGQFNNNNISNNSYKAHMNNNTSYIQQKYVFRHVKGKEVISLQNIRILLLEIENKYDKHLIMARKT